MSRTINFVSTLRIEEFKHVEFIMVDFRFLTSGLFMVLYISFTFLVWKKDAVVNPRMVAS